MWYFLRSFTIQQEEVIDMDFWIVLIYAAYLCLVRHLAIEEIYLRSLHLFLVWCGITFMLGVFKATEWLDLGPIHLAHRSRISICDRQG